MERVRRLNQLWSWLPAFRVVGETEHLPTAARHLLVTPPALSRAVGNLEGQLGVKLFERRGRRIALTRHGRVMLDALRDAMRLLDDAVVAVRGEELAGDFRIAGPSPFLSIFVLPALARLAGDYPRMRPVLTSAGPHEANRALLKGELDLALLDDPVPADEVSIHKLVDVTYGIYCGPGHPLYAHPSPRLDDVLAHPFAAPPSGDDHWPAHLPRKVGMALTQLHLGVQVCAQGRYLALLPDVVAARGFDGVSLYRIPLDVVAPQGLYAVCRKRMGRGGAVERVIEVLGQTIVDVAEGRGKPSGGAGSGT